MKTILDDLVKQEGTVKSLGCKVGRTYTAISKFKQENKSKPAKINSYGLMLALELFEKTKQPARYTAVENGMLIDIKINKI